MASKTQTSESEQIVKVTCRECGRDTNHVVLKRSEEHTSELQSRLHLVCRLLLEKKIRFLCFFERSPTLALAFSAGSLLLGLLRPAKFIPLPTSSPLTITCGLPHMIVTPSSTMC